MFPVLQDLTVRFDCAIFTCDQCTDQKETKYPVRVARGTNPIISGSPKVADAGADTFSDDTE